MDAEEIAVKLANHDNRLKVSEHRIDDLEESQKKAGIRAVKTFAQTFAGFITVGAAVSEINWKYALSVSAVAFVYSVVISVAGIPEAESEE